MIFVSAISSSALQKWSCRSLRRTFFRVSTSIAFFANPLGAETSIFFESDPLQQKIDSINSTMDSLPLSANHPSLRTFGDASGREDVPDGSMEMIANPLAADHVEPGMGPQIFPCATPVLNGGRRITVTQCARNTFGWRTSPVVALSELFTHADGHNAALHGQVAKQLPTKTRPSLFDHSMGSPHLSTRETKDFARFIENEEQDHDRTDQLAKVNHPILVTIPVKFSLKSSSSFNALEISNHWILLLFFKEPLNNIIKHARATAVVVHTRRTGSALRLETADNGCGIPQGLASCRHLGSRAKVFGRHLSVPGRMPENTRATLNFSQNSQS